MGRSPYATPRPYAHTPHGSATAGSSTGKRSRGLTPASAAGHASSYSFPLLPPAEILACMQELQIPFSEQQLLQPSPEHLRSVLEQLLELLVGVPREQLAAPLSSALEALGFPELHNDSATVLAFHRAAQRLMGACGVHDFSFNDYLKPEYPRVRRILSGIINLAKFREERLQRFQQVAGQFEGVFERRANLQKQVAASEAQVRKWNERRDAERPRVTALEAETVELAAEITALNKQQLKLQADIRELKAQANEMGDRIANQKFALLQARQESAKLQAMIVSSPERVQAQLADMEAEVERDQQHVEHAERRTRQLQSERDALERYERELQELMRLLGDAERDTAKSKELAEALEQRREQLAEKEAALRSLTQERAHLDKQLALVEERLARIRTQSEARTGEAQAQLQELNEAYEAARSDQRDVEHAAQRNQTLADQMQVKIDELRREHAAETDALRAKYDSLEQEVVAYHRRLFTAMQQTRRQREAPTDHYSQPARV